MRISRTVAMAAVALSFGCRSQSDKPGTKPHAASAVPRSAPGPDAGVLPFTLRASAPPHVGDHQPASLSISLESTSGFHINPDYPINFRVDSGSLALFEKSRYEAEAAQKRPCPGPSADTCHLDFAVAFTAPGPGAHRAGGTLAFSVCDPNICLIQKEPVAADFQVP